MKHYQAVRISRNGTPTYGDKYARIVSANELSYNQIVAIGTEKYIILFAE